MGGGGKTRHGSVPNVATFFICQVPYSNSPTSIFSTETMRRSKRPI